MEQEKKWWDDRQYYTVFAGQEWCVVYDIPKLLAEARKRHTEEIIKVLEERLNGIKKMVDEEKIGSIQRACLVAVEATLKDAIEVIKNLNPSIEEQKEV